MSETKTLKCNCGCGESIEKKHAHGWFKLVQRSNCQARYSDLPNVDETLHFATFECLAKWTKNAEEALAELRERAKLESSLRNPLYSEKCKDLYI